MVLGIDLRVYIPLLLNDRKFLRNCNYYTLRHLLLYLFAYQFIYSSSCISLYSSRFKLFVYIVDLLVVDILPCLFTLFLYFASLVYLRCLYPDYILCNTHWYVYRTGLFSLLSSFANNRHCFWKKPQFSDKTNEPIPPIVFLLTNSKLTNFLLTNSKRTQTFLQLNK